MISLGKGAMASFFLESSSSDKSVCVASKSCAWTRLGFCSSCASGVSFAVRYILLSTVKCNAACVRYIMLYPIRAETTFDRRISNTQKIQ